jgi:cysteine-rich repeat protein
MCADYKATCQTATAKDVVYQVTPDCDGELSAEASTPGFFQPILYARSECSNAATELGCTDIQSQAIKFPVLASQTYYLMVTGAMFPGQYVIDTTIICSVCGNGVLEGSEECDDGNSEDGDGCSKACKSESAGPADTCPGATLTFVDSAGTLVATATGDTTLLYAQYAGTCGMTDASGDAVYQLNTGAGGTLTATLETPGTAFDSVLYIRSGTCAQGTEVECADVAGNGGESITLTVQPNQDLWVFVDGHDSERGPYALKVTLVP